MFTVRTDVFKQPPDSEDVAVGTVPDSVPVCDPQHSEGEHYKEFS